MSDAQDESWSAFFGKTMLFPPIVAERRAYIVTLDSVLHAIEMPVGRKGRRCFVWTLYLSGAAQEQPQLKDVQLHVGVGGSPHEQDQLWCTDARSGRINWTWRRVGHTL